MDTQGGTMGGENSTLNWGRICCITAGSEERDLHRALRYTTDSAHTHTHTHRVEKSTQLTTPRF